MARLRAVLKVVVLLAAEAGFLVALYEAGPALGTVPFGHLSAWLQQPVTQTTLTAVGRLVGLAVGWWLLVATMVSIAAGVGSMRQSSRGWRLITLPVVRKLVEGAVGVSMLVSTVAASGVGGASAATLRSAAVVQLAPGHLRGAGSIAMVATVSGAVVQGVPAPSAAGTLQQPHLPHPGQLDETPPPVTFFDNPAAPGPDNGFAGLAAGTPVYVVQKGDCLSVVADRLLKDWRLDDRIFDLNKGLPQRIGVVLTEEHWIYPGQVLVLPPEAAGAPGVIVVGATPRGAQGLTVPATVSPAPTSQARAAASPPASSTVSPPDAAARAPTVASPPASPNTAAATTVPLAAPPASKPAATKPAVTKPPATTAGTVARAGSSGLGVQPVRSRGRSAASVPGWLLPAGGGGATLLATFALLEGRRRRARSLRRARAGSVMAPTDPTVDPLLRAVQRAADVGAVERLQAALYHLAMIDRPGLRPQVLLRHPDGRIDVQLFSGSEPVAPWTAAPSNKVFWTLDPDAELPDPDPEVVPCPALVQLGVCGDDAELYVDLEGIGILGLDGSPETVRQIARALTATLVVSPAGELCRVLTMGFDPYGLDEQVEDRFVVAKSVEWLLDSAEAGAKEVVEAIAGENAGSSFRLRAVDTDAGWEPTVAVVAGVALAGDEVRRLERLAGDGGLGAAVVCPTDRAAWNLELVDPAGGWWQLNPLSIRVRPVQIAVDELQDLAAYLADADVEPVEVGAAPNAGRLLAVDGPAVPAAPLELPVAPRLDVPAASGNGTAPPLYVERDWKVMICLLGPPYATNRDGVVMGDSGRTAPLQLLAWLVSNRDTATRVGAREALWGGEVVAPKTVVLAFNRAKALLRELAGDPGAEFITRDNDRIRLDPLVVSDYELVADRVAFARHLDDPAEAAEVLAGGLERIRGVPLIGTNWVWADDNHLSSNMAMAASALATDLAALHLQLGQTAAAVAATTVGLQVIPGNDELTRLRIQACIDGGDRREAWSVYEEYARRTAARGEDIHPDIAELRIQLTRAGRAQS